MRGRGLAVALLVAGCTPGDAGAPPRCRDKACDAGEDEPPRVVPVRVSRRGPIRCAEPHLRDERPFDLRLSMYEADIPVRFMAGGVAVGDLNGDGYEDIVIPGFRITQLYEGGPDGFTPSSLLDGFELTQAAGASMADYDGDGDLDLLITRFLATDVLLRNDDGVLVDVTAEVGLLENTIRSVSSSWGDYDGDGDLDLFIGGYGFIDERGVPHSQFDPADPSFLYRNDGGTFTDVSHILPKEAHDGYTFTGGFLDLDGDLLPELYIVNDFGVAYPNRLLWNRGGGVFELDQNAVGLDVQLTAMGLGFGDFNGDGVPDMVMPAWARIGVLESTPIGVWVETSRSLGVVFDLEHDQKIGWGVDLVDVDNDGDLDMPIAFGHLDTLRYDSPLEQPDALFLQEPDGRFVDRAPEWGLDERNIGRGYVATDLNDDGWLDFVKRSLNGPTRLHLSRCGTESWLRVRLRAPSPNTRAIGARVHVEAGGERQVRWILAGGTNLASAGPAEAHFGLGPYERVDRLEVFWPDGALSILEDVEARHILHVHRDEAWLPRD